MLTTTVTKGEWCSPTGFGMGYPEIWLIVSVLGFSLGEMNDWVLFSIVCSPAVEVVRLLANLDLSWSVLLMG